MQKQISCEIHFHQENEASVFIESNTGGTEELEMESLLFALLSIRQITNLRLPEVCDPLAETLLRTTATLPLLLQDHPLSGISLTPYQGYPGRKRFLATAIANAKTAHSFTLQPKGFGLLARGVGYYAPVSVIILLRALLRRRHNHKKQLGILAFVAERIGELQLNRQIIPHEQNALASKVLLDAINLHTFNATASDIALSLWTIVNDTGFRIATFTSGRFVLVFRERLDCEEHFQKGHSKGERIEKVAIEELLAISRHSTVNPPSEVLGIAIFHGSKSSFMKDRGSPFQTLSFAEAAVIFDEIIRDFYSTQ